MLVGPGHLRWKVALLCTPPFGGASCLRAVCAAHVSLSDLSALGLCCRDWRPVSTHAARCAVGFYLVLGFIHVRQLPGRTVPQLRRSSRRSWSGCGVEKAGPGPVPAALL